MRLFRIIATKVEWQARYSGNGIVRSGRWLETWQQARLSA
jgi:hypothetical protein